MHDSDGERLARTYEPVLLFSRDGRGIDESFFPMDAAHFVAGSRLYREGAGLVAPAGRLTLDRLASVPAGESADHFLAFGLDDAFEFHAQPDAWAPRREAVRPAAGRRGGAASAGVAAASSAGGADESSKFAASRRLPHAVRDSVLVRYGAYRDLRRHPPPYYYRVMHDGGYLVIQYWMFYAYNDWGLAHNGLNDHEGDWEAVFVYLQDGEPAYVAYSAHVGSPATYEWASDSFEKRFDSHPVVFVACGSHAAYAASGQRDLVIRAAPGLEAPVTYTDYNRGDSQGSLGPGTGAAWGLPVDLDRQSWTIGYAGRWGALITRLDGREIGRGAQGPVGPAWQTEKWQSPVDWAQIPG